MFTCDSYRKTSIYNLGALNYDKPIQHPTCRVIFKPELKPYTGTLFQKIKTWFENRNKVYHATTPKCIRHITLNGTFRTWLNYPCSLATNTERCQHHLPGATDNSFGTCHFCSSRYDDSDDKYLCLTEDEYNELLVGEIIKAEHIVWGR